MAANAPLTSQTDDDLLLAEWAVEDCRNLYHLTKHTLGFDRLTPQPHADLCDFLTNTGKYTGRLTSNWKLILLPRGTYKTTVGVIGLAVQALLRNPDVRILIDSETRDKSVDTLRAIKGVLTRDLFRRVHGALNVPQSREAQSYIRTNRYLPWNEDAIVLGTRKNFNLKEPTISVSGVDVVKVGMHYDLVIGDDYHSKDNVTTKEQIEKVIQHIQLMTNIIDPQAAYIILGTRWDDKDAYGWIIHDVEGLRITQPGVYKGKLFDIMVYPWRWGEARPQSTVHPETHQRPGCSYFAPSIWNEETIQRVKTMLSPYNFSCQMENNPVDEESAAFKSGWVKWVTAKEIPTEDVAVFTAVDPAIGLGERSDYSACVTVLYDSRGNRFLLDAHYGRWSEDQLVDEVIGIYRRFRPLQIAFESVSGFKAFETVFREICARRKVFLPLVFVPRDTRQSKDTRIRALAPIFSSQTFHVVQGARGVAEFWDEYRRYPRARHDDVLDALADVEAIKWMPDEGAGILEEAYQPLDAVAGY